MAADALSFAATLHMAINLPYGYIENLLDFVLYIARYNDIKGVTAKISMSLSISGHTLVTESLKLGPRVKLFE